MKSEWLYDITGDIAEYAKKKENIYPLLLTKQSSYMKKKNMYIGTALLTLGLGFSAMAYNGLIPIPFAGAAVAAAEEEVEPTPDPEPELSYFATPTSNIETGDKLSSYPGVTEIWFHFNLGTSDDPLPLGSGTITITKDGAAYKSYEIGTAPEVYIGKSWITRLYVDFGGALEPGEYEVTVPEGAVEMEYVESSDSGSGKLVRKKNRKIVTTFTVVKGFEYSVVPTLGSKPVAADMQTITLTYPQGVTPEVSGSISLKKYSLGAVSDVTTYSASVSANVVTLTCADVKAITPCVRDMQFEYYFLDVPAYAFTLTDGTGSYQQGAFTVGNWNVVADTKGMIFTPSFDTPNLKIDDLETITVELPENTSLANANVEKGTTAFFKIFPNPVNNSYYYDYLIESNVGNKYVCKRKAATSSTVANCRPELCMKGSTTLRIASNVLQTVEYIEVEVDGQTELQPKYTKLGQMDFDAYELDGKANILHYNSSPANGGTSTKINSFTLNFVQKAKVANPDAYISLSLNGVSLKKVKVSETTTAAAAATGAGSNSVAFANKFKNAEGLDFTDPGVYEFRVEAGAFKDITYGYLNEEIKVQAYIPGDVEYSIFPAPCTVTGTDPDFVMTPGEGEAPTTIKEVIITFPNAVNVEINPNMYSINMNSSLGQLTYKNAAKGGAPQNYSGYKPDYRYEVIGKNQVKVICNEYAYPTPDNYVVGLKIYQGSFIITEMAEGDMYPTRKVSKTMTFYYPGLPMQKPDAIDADGNVLENVVLHKEDTYITIKAAGSIYPHEVTGDEACYVADAEGNKLFNVSQSHPDGLQAIMQLKFPTGKTLAPGAYKLVIPVGGLQGGSSSVTSSIVVYNKEEFVYDFTVEPNYVDIDALFTRMYPEETFTLKTWEFGPTMYVIQVNEPITLKGNLSLLYEGEELTPLDITNEGLISYIPGETITPDEPGVLAEGDATTSTSGMLQINLDAIEGLSEYVKGLPGKYSVKFPKGSVEINGDVNNEFQLDYTYEALPVDFTYELNPAPVEGGTVNDLSIITLTFPNSAAVTYDVNVATLEMPDGTILKQNYPEYTEDGKGLIFKFNAKNGWIDGQYKFTVNPMTVCVDTPEDAPNFPGLEVYYTLEVPESLNDHISKLVTPSAFDCDPSSATSPYGAGLGFIELGLDSDKITLNNDCLKTIDVYRDGKRIFSHNLSVESQENDPTIAIITVGGLADDGSGIIDGPVNCSLYIINAAPGSGRENEFNVTGTYKIVIPDGAFKLNGVPLSSATLEYNYSSESKADFSYDLTPANDESYAGEPEDFLKTITLKATAATFINYAGNGGATLEYTPESGEKVEIPRDGYPETNMVNTITYKFGNKAFDWDTVGDGTYTFSVPAGYITINDMYWEEEPGTGNFPAVTAVYHVSGSTTGITMIGIEAADSYNVFTIDGKAVKLNAAPAELIELEEGLYIINGKKTYLRK